MVRRLFIVMLALVLITGLAAAQDEQRAVKFMQAFQQAFNPHDLTQVIELVSKNPDAALEAAAFVGQHWSEFNESQQTGAMGMLNIIARVLETRNNDNRLSQELAAKGLLMPDSAWAGTLLATSAGATTGTTPSGPVAPGDDIDLVKALLRLGNYQDAAAVNQAIMPDHVDQLPRLMRYGLLSMAGLGYTYQAVSMAEENKSMMTSPEDKLGLALLTSYAAFKSALPNKARPALQEASALAANYPGAYGQVARFLTKSWLFSLDLQQNPNMPLATLKQRHDDAWKEIAQLSPEHRDELTSEFYWVGETYLDVWVEQMIGIVYKYNLLESLQPLMMGDAQQTLAWMQQLSPGGHIEGPLTSMIAFMKLIGLYQDSGENLADARSMLVRVKEVVPELHEAIAASYVELELKYGDLLKRKNLKLNPSKGTTNLLVGGMYLLDANQIMCENEDKTLSPADSSTVKKDLDQAAAALSEAINLELLQSLAVGQLDYLEKAKPAGWDKSSEELINGFLTQEYLQNLRLTQAGMLYRRGKLRLAQKRGSEAVADFQKAIDIFEGYIREVGGGADSAAFLRLFAFDLYESMAKAQLEQGKSGDAFTTIGRAQQVSSSGVFQMDDLRGQVKKEDQQLVTRAEQGKAEIQVREKNLANLRATRASTEQIQHASQLLAQSRESYYKTVTDLESKYPAFEKLDIKPINFSKLQRAIPPNTLVVLLFPTDDQLYLMEATSDNLLVRQVAVKKSDLEEMARDFRVQMAAFARGPHPFSWKSPEAAPLKSNLSQLYNTVIKPIEPDMANKQAVAFVPYGNLVYLPFQAFLTENPDGGVTFLVEKKQLVVLSKAADLDQIYGPPSDKTGNLVAFGNPDGSLAGATQEVQALGTIFPGSQVYVEAQATSDKVQAVQAPKVSYLHLATHGNLNASDPRESYLTMAKGGKLSIRDITGFHLDTPAGDLNLVTLSACQTNLGDRGGAGDGSDVRSLADAFSFAGCRSMVASLWKVEDNATRDLMVELYKNLKAGKTKAEALQSAQVTLLKQDKYAHPFFWAPFILIGDWR